MKLVTKEVVDINPVELLKEKYPYFDWNSMNLDNLYLDFGVEYFSTSSKETLIWNLEFVKHIFKHRLKTRKPIIHNWCQFSGLGGANSHELTQKSEFKNLIYTQMYMNEKEIFYTFGKRSVFDFSPYDIMTGNTDKIRPCIKYFLQTLNSARRTDTKYSARIEYRISFEELRSNCEIYYNMLESEQNRVYVFPGFRV
jgi:hypothetical protein